MTKEIREIIIFLCGVLGIVLTLGIIVWPSFAGDGNQGYWLAFALPCHAVTWENFAAKRGYGRYLWGSVMITFLGCALVAAIHAREILALAWTAFPVLMLIGLAVYVALFWRSRPAEISQAA